MTTRRASYIFKFSFCKGLHSSYEGTQNDDNYNGDKVQIRIYLTTCGCVAAGTSGLCMELSNPCSMSSLECVHSIYTKVIILSHNVFNGWKHTYSLFVVFNGYLPFAHCVRW